MVVLAKGRRSGRLPMCATVGFFLRRKMDDEAEVDWDGVGTAGFGGILLVVVVVPTVIASLSVLWVCVC